MKHNTNQKYLSFACADVRSKTIQVTKQTSELARKGNRAAINLIEHFRKKYPFYKVIESDEILIKLMSTQLS